MEAATTTPRRRGRPREFEHDEVLDQVMTLFWQQGFEATSMADIVEVTALNKSSLYNAFGSKEGLFALALDRYLEMRNTMVTGPLTEGTAGLADLEDFLDFMHAQASGDAGRFGCLAINTSNELGVRDDEVVKMSLEFRDEIRTALRAALTRAEAAGEIEAGSVDRHAAILLSFMLSLPVIARSGAQPAELDGQFAAARAMLADWRIDA